MHIIRTDRSESVLLFHTSEQNFVILSKVECLLFAFLLLFFQLTNEVNKMEEKLRVTENLLEHKVG
jgi:hypothetical protein